MLNGFCIADTNCKAVDNNGQCVSCISGYRIINGMCLKNSITDCVNQLDDDCLECASGTVKISLYGQVYCLLMKIAYNGCMKQEYPCTSGCQVGFEMR